MDQFRFWQIGGVGGASTERTLQVAPFLLVGGAPLPRRRARAQLPGPRRRPRRGAWASTWPAPACSPRSARSCSAARRPRSPGRSPSSGWPCRTCAGSWSAPTTAGCCPSPLLVGAVLLTAADVVGRVVRARGGARRRDRHRPGRGAALHLDRAAAEGACPVSGPVSAARPRPGRASPVAERVARGRRRRRRHRARLTAPPRRPRPRRGGHQPHGRPDLLRARRGPPRRPRPGRARRVLHRRRAAAAARGPRRAGRGRVRPGRHDLPDHAAQPARRPRRDRDQLGRQRGRRGRPRRARARRGPGVPAGHRRRAGHRPADLRARLLATGSSAPGWC